MKSAVVRYLPRLLREWKSNNRETNHNVTQHSRILLFADASGFTVLTRNLSLQGRVGFEHLTDLLNNLFASLAADVARHNGDILKFSGDAVWCCFPEGTNILKVYAEMLTTIETINREQVVCRQFRCRFMPALPEGPSTCLPYPQTMVAPSLKSRVKPFSLHIELAILRNQANYAFDRTG